MAYVPYRTATGWKNYYAQAGTVATDDTKIRIDILGALENLQAMTSSNTSSAIFQAQAGVNTYSVSDVPELANLVGKELIACIVAGGVVSLSLVTWNDSDLVFNASIEFDGTETITVLANI